MAEAVERLGLSGLDVETAFQLQLEHAAAFSRYDRVILADADKAGEEPFSFRPLLPIKDLPFSSHSMPAEALLYFAQELFRAKPTVHVLGIRGYSFDPGAEMTAQAKENLNGALIFLQRSIPTILSASIRPQKQIGGRSVVCDPL